MRVLPCFQLDFGLARQASPIRTDVSVYNPNNLMYMARNKKYLLSIVI